MEVELAEEELEATENGLQKPPFGTHAPWMFPHKGQHPVLYSSMALSSAEFLPTQTPLGTSLSQGYVKVASLRDGRELRLALPPVFLEVPFLRLVLPLLIVQFRVVSFLEKEREAGSDTTVTKLCKRN